MIGIPVSKLNLVVERKDCTVYPKRQCVKLSNSFEARFISLIIKLLTIFWPLSFVYDCGKSIRARRTSQQIDTYSQEQYGIGNAGWYIVG